MSENKQQRPDVQRQMVFAEGGEIEPEEGPIGTSLEDYGAEVDHRERTARIDKPSASEFGVDVGPEGYLTPNDDYETALVVIDELDKGTSKQRLARWAGIARPTIRRIDRSRERYLSRC